MYELNTRTYEIPERIIEEIVNTVSFNRFKGTGGSSWSDGERTDNAGLLDFKMQISKGHNNVLRFMCSARRLKARNATTEFTIEGANLGVFQGLQVMIMKVTSETREGNQYSNSGQPNVIPAPNFSTRNLREDFPPVEKYYLWAFDPDKAHLVTEAHDVWYLQCDTTTPTKYYTVGDEINIAYNPETSEVYGMHIAMTGLDYLKSAKLCTMLNKTPENGPTITDAPGLNSWLEWLIESSIDDAIASNEEIASVKGKEWIAPVVKYNEQFKEAEEIFRVGHLRFVRLAEGGQGSGSNSVVDHVQWYGIIPVLNVEKSMNITLDHMYYQFHTDNACSVCSCTNLELPPGKYAIDVNKTCFYYGKGYTYPHGKKAWILTMLANAQVIIEKSIADRIIPVGEMQDMSNIAYNDSDDFLNRI